MGNIICFNENTPVDNWICMSNTATDVFINVLLLNGSVLTETVEEKQLIVWLSEKDQKFVGLGQLDLMLLRCLGKRKPFQIIKYFY